MRLGLLAALALVLSGCADNGGPPAAAEPSQAADETGEARVGRPSSPVGDASETLPPAIDVSWEGALAVRLCAPSGPNSCMGASAPTAGKDDSLFVESGLASWTGSLTLTWDAASPATETLQFRLGFYEKCGATCWQGLGGSASVVGSSPLVLDVQALEAPASSQGLWVAVNEERLTPDPVYAIASVGQEFTVDGRLEPS